MAKEINIINNPNEMAEHVEFEDLAYFTRHLWFIVQNYSHSDEKLNQKETRYKRYNDALKAIFGDLYFKIRECPAGYTYEDIREMVLRGNETNNLQEAIKEALEEKYPKSQFKDKQEQFEFDSNREETILKEQDKIRQHIHQLKPIYEGKNFEEGIGFPWGY